MDELDFSRQVKVLAFLIGHESTAELFNQAFQEAVDNLKGEAEAGQDKEIIYYRIGRLKTLLFIQTVWNKTMVQMEQAKGGEGIMPGEVGLA